MAVARSICPYQQHLEQPVAEIPYARNARLDKIEGPASHSVRRRRSTAPGSPDREGVAERGARKDQLKSALLLPLQLSLVLPVGTRCRVWSATCSIRPTFKVTGAAKQRPVDRLVGPRLGPKDHLPSMRRQQPFLCRSDQYGSY